MMGTWWKRCDRRTDRQTDGRTDGRTDWTSHIAAWSQLKRRLYMLNVLWCFLKYFYLATAINSFYHNYSGYCVAPRGYFSSSQWDTWEWSSQLLYSTACLTHWGGYFYPFPYVAGPQMAPVEDKSEFIHHRKLVWWLYHITDIMVFIHENAPENIICQNGGHFVQGEMT